MAESLGQLQRRFWRLITAPEGVARALPAESARDPQIVPLRSWINGPTEDFARARLDVYANMYFYRLLDVVKGDYPKILSLVGELPFHNLVTDYVLRYPSENASLRYLGERFADFIRESSLAREWPYLYDLALLEWARVDIFDLADEPVLAREELRAVSPASWGRLLLTPIRALRLLSLSAPVHQLWLAHEATPEIVAAPTFVLVWRWRHHVYHRALSPSEASALALLIEGAPFSLLCECFEGPSDEDISSTARRALAAINWWLDEGILGSMQLAPEAEEAES